MTKGIRAFASASATAALCALSGCSDPPAEASRPAETAHAKPAETTDFRFVRPFPGHAEEKWSDGRPVRYGEFEFRNRSGKSMAFHGVDSPSGFSMSYWEARIYERSQGRWTDPFNPFADMAPPPDKLTVVPGGTQRIVVPLQPEMFDRDSQWKVCITDLSSEFCSQPFRLRDSPQRAP